MTTGTPISMLIENVDQRSKDYGEIAERYRPGHADYTYDAKYGVRDYRGGGRQSARETATRVAAGAIARKVLDKLYGKVTIRGALVQMGTERIVRANWSWDEVGNNPFFCPDPKAAAAWEVYLVTHPHLVGIFLAGHGGGGEAVADLHALDRRGKCRRDADG